MNVGASNDHYKTKELVFMANFNKKFTENLGFNAQFMKQTWMRTWLNTELTELQLMLMGM